MDIEIGHILLVFILALFCIEVFKLFLSSNLKSNSKSLPIQRASTKEKPVKKTATKKSTKKTATKKAVKRVTKKTK